MSGIPPLTPQDVPFRKIRDAINLLVAQINRQRPINDGPMELLPNGFRVKREQGGGSGYTPPFSQVLTEGDSPTLGITPGHVFIPTDTGGTSDHEIQDYALYPHMPTLSGTALDAATAPTIGLTASATNYIYLQFTLVSIQYLIGTNSGENGGTSGTVGIKVLMSDDTDGGGGNHTYACAQAENMSYRVNAGPTFQKQVGNNPDGDDDFPRCTETTINIPWGKIALDASGLATTNTWYRTGDFDFFPQNYVKDYVAGNNPRNKP